MMVSIATAVLPVWRSPMMSSRWPRPIGIMASIALRPVCSGSCTDLRATMPGALISTLRIVLGGDRALAVDRLAERVDHAADQRVADRDRGDLAGALDLIVLADLLVLAEERDADVVLFEVEDDAADVVRELEQLAGHGAGQAVDARDAVTDGEHGAGLDDRDLLVVLLDLLADDLRDLFGLDFHVVPFIRLSSSSRSCCKLSADAAVVDDIAELRDEAADDASDLRASPG